MPASPIEVVGQWLQNLLDPDVVSDVVAPDATYVSLNTENGELAQMMPWAGSFRKNGSWTVQTEPGAEPFQVSPRHQM